MFWCRSEPFNMTLMKIVRDLQDPLKHPITVHSTAACQTESHCCCADLVASILLAELFHPDLWNDIKVLPDNPHVANVAVQTWRPPT